MNLLKRLLSKKVEQKKEELLIIRAEIDNKLENMHYAKWNGLGVREDYLYTDLTKLWKKQKQYKRFIKLFS